MHLKKANPAYDPHELGMREITLKVGNDACSAVYAKTTNDRALSAGISLDFTQNLCGNAHKCKLLKYVRCTLLPCADT